LETYKKASPIPKKGNLKLFSGVGKGSQGNYGGRKEASTYKGEERKKKKYLTNPVRKVKNYKELIRLLGSSEKWYFRVREGGRNKGTRERNRFWRVLGRGEGSA